MARIGLIAGNGKFPFLALQGARDLGHEVIVIAIKEEAFPDLEELTDSCPRGCTHGGSEPECGLDTAIADGRTEPARVESFRRLLASRERSEED